MPCCHMCEATQAQGGSQPMFHIIYLHTNQRSAASLHWSEGFGSQIIGGGGDQQILWTAL